MIKTCGQFKFAPMHELCIDFKWEIMKFQTKKLKIFILKYCNFSIFRVFCSMGHTNYIVWGSMGHTSTKKIVGSPF